MLLAPNETCPCVLYLCCAARGTCPAFGVDCTWSLLLVFPPAAAILGIPALLRSPSHESQNGVGRMENIEKHVIKRDVQSSWV